MTALGNLYLYPHTPQVEKSKLEDTLGIVRDQYSLAGFGFSSLRVLNQNEFPDLGDLDVLLFVFNNEDPFTKGFDGKFVIRDCFTQEQVENIIELNIALLPDEHEKFLSAEFPYNFLGDYFLNSQLYTILREITKSPYDPQTSERSLGFICHDGIFGNLSVFQLANLISHEAGHGFGASHIYSNENVEYGPLNIILNAGYIQNYIMSRLFEEIEEPEEVQEFDPINIQQMQDYISAVRSGLPQNEAILMRNSLIRETHLIE